MVHGSLARGWAQRRAAAAFAGPLGHAAERLAVALGHAFPYGLPGRTTLQAALYDGLSARNLGGPLIATLQTGQALEVPLSPEGVSLYVTGCLMGEDEGRITRLFRRYLRQADRFADVGAHLGFYTHLAAASVGTSGRVFAFEPQPELAGYLRRSLARNRLDGGVELIEAAVGTDHDATTTLFAARDPANTGSASTLPHGWVRDDGAREVRTVRLDRVLREPPRDGGPLDAIKIDVEGAEDRVVGGMSGLFPGDAPRLMMIELMGAIPGSAAAAGRACDICDLLHAQGYEGWRIDPDGKLRTRFGEADAHALDAIVNIAFTAPGLAAKRPEVFG